MKNSQVGRKPPNRQTKKISNNYLRIVYFLSNNVVLTKKTRNIKNLMNGVKFGIQ